MMTKAEATEAIAELLWPEGGAPEGDELDDCLAEIVADCIAAGYGPKEEASHAA